MPFGIRYGFTKESATTPKQYYCAEVYLPAMQSLR